LRGVEKTKPFLYGIKPKSGPGVLTGKSDRRKTEESENIFVEEVSPSCANAFPDKSASKTRRR
jgi:hypothetical protein